MKTPFNVDANKDSKWKYVETFVLTFGICVWSFYAGWSVAHDKSWWMVVPTIILSLLVSAGVVCYKRSADLMKMAYDELWSKINFSG